MKHKHAELIKQWADGAIIQWSFANSIEWSDVKNNTPSWDDYLQYRVKPPEPKWPETTMTYEQMRESYYVYGRDHYEHSSWHSDAAKNLANAAIAHACETGHLVLPDPERDMKIAQAAWSAGVNSQSSLELKSIIKEATK